MHLSAFCAVKMTGIHSGQFDSQKISKIGATRCQILRLKCTKIDFGWGSAPDPAGGAYSTPHTPLAVFKGPTSKGKEGKGEERREREGRRKGKGRGEEGEGKNHLTHPLSQIPGTPLPVLFQYSLLTVMDIKFDKHVPRDIPEMTSIIFSEKRAWPGSLVMHDPDRLIFVFFCFFFLGGG